MKKVIVFVMVMLITLGAIPVTAANFTDVTSDHWAKSYIDDMTERGLFTGFSDGTFRPNDSITLIQSLAILSRMYKVDAESKQLILEEYNNYLKPLLDNTDMRWAIPELAICLEAGIVTKTELTSYATGKELGKPIKKEHLAVLLVRALQLEEEALALTGYTLPFEDYLFITYTRRPHCYMLYKLEIVSGDTANRFNPQSDVSRAISSTMLSRSLTYLEKENKELKITRFSEYKTEGILSEIGSGDILIKGYNGAATRIIVPRAAYVKVNGANGTLSSDYKGHPITLVWSKEDDSLKGLEINTTIKAVQGAIKGLSTATSTPEIYITDIYSAVVKGYALGDTSEATYEGETVGLSSLKVGSFATVLLKNDVVSDIIAFNGTYKLKGSVRTVVYGDPITLVVKLEDNTEYEYQLNPKSLPSISRGGQRSSIDKIRIGDIIEISVTNSEIKQIDAEVKKADLTGTVKSIVKDIQGNRLTFADDNGTEYTYPIASGVQVTQGKNRISLDNLVGSKADFVISDGEITSIDVVAAIATSNRISGSVLYVNKTEQSLLLEVTHENGTRSNITVRVKTSTKILSANTGANVNFSTLEIYDILDIYGAYDSDMVFQATVIIVR